MYNVEFSKTSERQFYKLEIKIQERIVSGLERCRFRPYVYVKKLVNSPYFSLRVGNYRLILEINKGKLIILVVEIGHRKKIYKK